MVGAAKLFFVCLLFGQKVLHKTLTFTGCADPIYLSIFFITDCSRSFQSLKANVNILYCYTVLETRKPSQFNYSSILKRISDRGGVKDTSLEAKYTKKKTEAKDSSSEDRPSRGQEPKTQAQVFSKKKDLQKFFSGGLRSERSTKNYSNDLQNFYHSKK